MGQSATVGGNAQLTGPTGSIAANSGARFQASAFVTITNNTGSAISFTIETEFTVSDGGGTATASSTIVVNAGVTHAAGNQNSAYVSVGPSGSKQVSARTRVLMANNQPIGEWLEFDPTQLIVQAPGGGGDNEHQH
jgi:hypothetical protein